MIKKTRPDELMMDMFNLEVMLVVVNVKAGLGKNPVPALIARNGVLSINVKND
jgi:hypothetical protein